MLGNILKLISFVLLALVLEGVLPAQDKCRGNYLRTEIRKTETQELYDCTLKSTRGAFPVLQFIRQVKYTFHEVRIYETLIRTLMEKDDNAPRGTGAYQFRLVPDEFIEGETSTRTEIRNEGNFAFENFIVNQRRLQTNEQGEILLDNASEIGILEFFDNLNARLFKLEIVHDTLGSKTVDITRMMPRRPKKDIKNLEENISNDLLVSFHLDYYQRLFEPERKQLKVEYFLNTLEIQPGIPFTVTVKITNQGKWETSGLLGRLFSREPCVNGKLFYFGAISPGKSLSFCRTIHPEKEIKVAHFYATLALCDNWGELPRLQKHLIIPVAK